MQLILNTNTINAGACLRGTYNKTEDATYLLRESISYPRLRGTYAETEDATIIGLTSLR